MPLNLPVRQYMSIEPVTVSVTDNVSGVRELLRGQPFNHVPVLEDGVLVGIISAVDIAEVSLERWGPDVETVDAELDACFAVRDVMTQEPDAIEADRPLAEAAEMLAEGRYHALPVVEGAKLVGVLSTTDLVRLLLRTHEALTPAV